MTESGMWTVWRIAFPTRLHDGQLFEVAAEPRVTEMLGLHDDDSIVPIGPNGPIVRSVAAPRVTGRVKVRGSEQTDHASGAGAFIVLEQEVLGVPQRVSLWVDARRGITSLGGLDFNHDNTPPFSAVLPGSQSSCQLRQSNGLLAGQARIVPRPSSRNIPQ
jgi:hypothetical protein